MRGKVNHLPPIFLVFRDHPRLCGEKTSLRCQGGTKSGSPPPMRGKEEHNQDIYSRNQDHPRLCGEKFRGFFILSRKPGSPPPMRGKVGITGAYMDETRITPAYAGKRLSSARYMRYRQDHPRLCGEKVTVAVPLIPYSGSPPPMRGKGKVHGKSIRPSRITPAYAGKRAYRHFPNQNQQDHPRLCGEKSS